MLVCRVSEKSSLFKLTVRLYMLFIRITPLLLFFTILTGCLSNIEDPEKIDEEVISHDLALDIEIDFYLKGQLEFKLIAKEMQQTKDMQELSIFPKGIKVFVYNQRLDTIATITSDFAIQNKHKKLVEASQNVILKNSHNEQLNTQKLFWNSNTKKIYTDDFVTINTENEIIMGYGFVTDESFSSYTLSNITGTVYL
ncbi:MAG: LPS export ABC transporter periplasmic protein LptC [Flavobacteriales bacterium]|nr:LPS export ABC transporter periplasmic protein LptC [Flavobacteriales bacterium]